MSVLTGDTHGLGGHAVTGQELALAFGGRAAVAPHRGDDEWLVTHLAQRIDDGPGHQVDGVNSAAADPDGDRSAGFDPLAQAALAGSSGGSFPARRRCRGWGIDCRTRASGG